MHEQRTISARGLVLGAGVGMASGLLLDYLALISLRLLRLPGPEASLEGLLASAWFVPVILAGTILGSIYYSRDA
jgi:hypothetical protein